MSYYYDNYNPFDDMDEQEYYFYQQQSQNEEWEWFEHEKEENLIEKKRSDMAENLKLKYIAECLANGTAKSIEEAELAFDNIQYFINNELSDEKLAICRKAMNEDVIDDINNDISNDVPNDIPNNLPFEFRKNVPY
jgi:hypothetical protein